jgi:xanthine dehydrogenase YagR molybdenum-binding subunit
MADEKATTGAVYSWPSKADSKLIGTSPNRIDAIEKATGAAKYSYDINLKGMLFCHALGSYSAHAKLKGIDISAAEKSPGVVHIHVLREPGYEIAWEGDLLAIVAAESDAQAVAAAQKIKLDLEELPVFTNDEDLAAAEKAERTAKGGGKVTTVKEPGDDDDEDEFVTKEIERLLKESKYTVEGYYGVDVITHCCLEPHGSTVHWEGNKLKAYLSTQNVSGTEDGFAQGLKITADDVEVICDYIGGGFGSKFAPDYWGIAAAEISKKTGRPVKFMLTRDQELKNGGTRPSGYIKVRLGADENGVVQVWDSEHWGTAGFQGGGVSHGVIPYVLEPKNYRRVATNIMTNAAPARAWRAPNHPQACAMSQTALDDLAAKMGANSYDIFMANLPNASNGKADVYAEELKIAAKLMDWDAKWHPHGKGKAEGDVVEGMGIGLHTWGGGANDSTTMVKIHPDGSVEAFTGSQDIGTGTRTVCAQVLAETFGLQMEGVKIHVGRSTYPFSGASGGSTTVGAVTESHRRAGQDALAKLFPIVAKGLDAKPEDLEAVGGRIQVKGKPDKSLSWKEACTKLGMKPLEVTAEFKRGTMSSLSNAGVGGVQMAHVQVDKATGVVKMKTFVAVQDMGLIINPKLASSQIYGSVIMGIAYSLFEQRLMDPKTGAFINCELADYKLPRLGDIGEILIDLYEPESERSRGVIGLGEPPVISPGAAISNAVCNALGVRVPVLPLTPPRVLEAIKNAGRA